MSPPDSKFSPLQSKERGICRDAGIGQKTNGHKYSSIAQSVEHSAVNRRVTGSSPVGGATSERVTLVPIFYCIKNPSPAPLFLLVSQKVTLRLCCSLVNALTTLRLATNFLRYGMRSAPPKLDTLRVHGKALLISFCKCLLNRGKACIPKLFCFCLYLVSLYRPVWQSGVSLKVYRIHAFINFMGTSMRSATCSGVIPLFKKRLHTVFIFSPTSIICLSGS